MKLFFKNAFYVLFIFLAGTSVCRAAPFSFAEVEEKARVLSKQDYVAEKVTLPEKLAKMDYDDFRAIRYVREAGPWYKKRLPFEVQFFHMGSIYQNSVKINEIAEGDVKPFVYFSSDFSFKDEPMFDLSSDLNYAGFRLHTTLNTPDYYDELISFLGASYFRALGVGQKYGLSARGLAVDTALSSGEEFPIFKEFWIERPMKGRKNITLYALLDSPSVTGAYKFLIIPGANTKVEVEASLFPRKDIQKVGIAPLTSMYLFGENTKNRFFDFRPEVHDSDGFLTANAAGECLWRPLDNARQLRVSSFQDAQTQGFGLMQRDRDAAHYQDFEAHYQERPSVWVEPMEPFGPGVVQLVEIPSDKEIHDNVVAYFVSDTPFKKGQEYRFKYRLNWFMQTNPVEVCAPFGKVEATYTGIGGVSGVGSETFMKFVIDFKGGLLDKVTDAARIEPVVTASSGAVRSVLLQKNPLTDGWRLVFDFKPDKNGGTNELRAYLQEKMPVSGEGADKKDENAVSSPEQDKAGPAISEGREGTTGASSESGLKTKDEQQKKEESSQPEKPQVLTEVWSYQWLP